MIARVVTVLAIGVLACSSLIGAYATEPIGSAQVIYYDQNGRSVPRQSVCDLEPGPHRGIAALREHLYYPPWERSLRVGGVVRVFVSLDSTGRVLETRIIQSARPKFDNIVVEAVRHTKWDPAWKNGQTIPIKFSFLVHFDPPHQHS